MHPVSFWMNLPRAFGASASQNSQKTALFWGDREFSYTELWGQSLAVAAQLQDEFGVKPGNRIALWLKNCPEFVPALMGALRTGAVVVPINNFLKPDEVNFILRDAGADLLITNDELGTHSAALRVARPELRLWHVEKFP